MVSAVVGSSAPSGIQSESLEFFNTTPLAVTGLVSTYVAGFAIGPLVTGPASELYGRRPVLIMAFALFSAFNLGTALATHIEVMLVFRFLAGEFPRWVPPVIHVADASLPSCRTRCQYPVDHRRGCYCGGSYCPFQI
jgi:MFS family permease